MVYPEIAMRAQEAGDFSAPVPVLVSAPTPTTASAPVILIFQDSKTTN